MHVQPNRKRWTNFTSVLQAVLMDGYYGCEFLKFLKTNIGDIIIKKRMMKVWTDERGFREKGQKKRGMERGDEGGGRRVGR